MSESFFARRSFIIVVVAVFCLPLIWAGTRRTLMSNTNNVKDWLPSGFEETAEHTWFQGHFPLEQFVLVSWRGRDANDPGCTLDDQRLEMLAKKLVPEPIEGADEPILDAEIVPHDELLADAENPLVQPTTSPPHAGSRVKQEKADPPLFKKVLTGTRLVQEMKARYPELPETEILKRLEGSLIGKDHYKTCLVVTLTDAAKGKNLRPTLWKIRELAEECGIRATSRVQEENDIRLGGPPVDNAAIDIEGERTLFRLAGLSAIVGLGISMICLRSVRLTFFVFWIALLAAGTGLALVYFTGGTCDAILLSMPSLVYVLAMSGGIHIINYYHDAIRDGCPLDKAPDVALSHGWFPCTMAAITTALGLGSLIVSHVIPISKFGLYAALGVLATLALIFLYLPALLYYYPSRKFAAEHGGRGLNEETETILLKIWRKIGGFVVRHNVAVSLVCVGVMVFFVFGLVKFDGTPRVKTSIKLMKLFSPGAEIINHYTWLEDHLGPLVPMEVLIAVDNETCDLNMLDRMRLTKEIEDLIETNLEADVGGALSAATFAPDLSRKRGRGILARLAKDSNESGLLGRLEAHRKEFSDYLTIDVERTTTNDPNLRHLRIPDEVASLLKAAKIKTLKDIQDRGDLTTIEGIGPQEAAQVNTKIAAWQAIRNPSVDELASPDLERLGLSKDVARSLYSADIHTLRDIQQFEDRGGKLTEIKGIGLDEFREIKDARLTWSDAHLAFKQPGIDRRYVEVLKSKGIRDLKALEPRKLELIEGIGQRGAEQIRAVVQDWRNAHGVELWRISARVWALTDMDYAHFVEDLRKVVDPRLEERRAEGLSGVEARYTGLVPLVYKTQHELMRGLVNSLISAFGLIAIVMIVVLRSPSAGMLAMIPNVFPVIVIFGFMGWAGILVDIGAMMTASVALGVAVDDTMHYLAWFREGLDEGHDRKGAAMAAYERCATAMTQTTLIGGLGLAVFAFSTFTPTQRFGMLMLVLLAAALVGDLIFLPAMLTGPLGRFFDRGRKRKRTSPIGAPAVDEDPGDRLVVPLDHSKVSNRHDRKHRPHKAS
jgi:predicted RND superfamily exporter protein